MLLGDTMSEQNNIIPLYLVDSYMKEFDATIKEVSQDRFIILDNTAFYPKSGGQPNDTGTITSQDGKQYKVIFVGKFNNQISHEVDSAGLKPGDKVHCIIDWERRHRLMRMHTAAHILSQVIHLESNALITGNQLDIEQSRIDFSIDNYDPELLKTYIERSNDMIDKDLPITSEYLPRVEAEKIPQLSKLAGGLPGSIKEVRVLKIGDFDIQADGGTHVRSTKEVGKLSFLKGKNAGKNNRRVYFSLVD